MKKVFSLMVFGIFLCSPISATEENGLFKERSIEEFEYSSCTDRATAVEIAFCGEVFCNNDVWFLVLFDCLDNG